MQPSPDIQFVSHNEIDKTRWDDCIDKAGNGLIYGYSRYLDHMAKQWDGLVLKDYEAVMPLTWNKKYNIHYLYQPFLCAQLGVFGKHIDAAVLNSFLDTIPSRFKYWDIYLNHGNVFALNDFKLYKRANYILDLNKPYDELYRSYRENIKRNLQKSVQYGCRPAKDFPAEDVIRLAVEQMRSYSTESKDNVERFRKLFQELYVKGKAMTYGIVSDNNELLSSAIFFFSHNRAYYILVGNHPNGRTIGASHALIDSFIKDHAGKNLLLDFEGSDIRNLAFFYSSFGGVEEKFAGVKLNRLPFYLKLFKK